MLSRLKSPNPARLALLIGGVASVTILGAWIFQAYGVAPCELCLKQRIAYYYGIPLAALTFFMAQGTGYRSLVSAGFIALALLFAFNSGFGVYHSGVEWGWWPGPTECTGAVQKAGAVTDFLKQLETTKVVRCDAVSLRIFGLSLAGWNAIICAGLALVAVGGARQTLSLFKR